MGFFLEVKDAKTVYKCGDDTTRYLVAPVSPAAQVGLVETTFLHKHLASSHTVTQEIDIISNSNDHSTHDESNFSFSEAAAAVTL